MRTCFFIQMLLKEENMTIITSYFNKLNLENILNLVIAKTVSLILLFIFFKISKALLHKLVKKSFSKYLVVNQSPARQKTFLKLIQNAIDYSAFFILLYWTLTILGFPVSSLLAGAGIAGVAIGLGAQGFLSDVVNGSFIIIENQFDVGDFIKVDTVAGTVSNVGIRTTQIRDLDGTLHFIPNRHITIVSNRSRGDMRVQIDIPIFADSPLEKMTEIISTVTYDSRSDFPELVGEPTILGARTLPNGQWIFRIDLFVQNGQQTRIYHAFYRRYQEALIAQGISLPTASIMSTTPL